MLTCLGSSTQSNKAFLLDVQADDLNEVNAADLEADAVAANASVIHVPSVVVPGGSSAAPAPAAV